MCRAIDGKLLGTDGGSFIEAVSEVQGLFESPAHAWAQFVLMDAWRIRRLWPNPLPFGACVMVSDVFAQAFGPPPSPLAVMEASRLTRSQFITATARGRASKLALSPVVAKGPESDLIVAVAEHAVQSWTDNRTAQLRAVGQLFRCLHVTSRRISGERVAYDYMAAGWTEAVDDDRLPLHVLTQMMQLCHADSTAMGLSVLLVLTSSPSAWIDRSWSQYGIHNFLTDVLALWGNVTRRLPPQLEPWALDSCQHLEEMSKEMPQLLANDGPKYVREYDPETDRYFACYSGLVAPSTWLPAATVPKHLKVDFATRRTAMRGSHTGRAFAALLSSAGEFGVPFVQRLTVVLDTFLKRLVPGDPGLADPLTLRKTADNLRFPGFALSWQALACMPQLLRIAVHAPAPLATDQGSPVVLRILKEALRSKQVARQLLALARSCYESAPDDAENCVPSLGLQFRLPCPELLLPNSVLLHAAMSLVSGTDPEQHRYTATMAALAAFAVPAAEVPPILLSVLFKSSMESGSYPIWSQRKCVGAALTGLSGRLPAELHTVVLRHWIVAAALNF